MGDRFVLQDAAGAGPGVIATDLPSTCGLTFTHAHARQGRTPGLDRQPLAVISRLSMIADEEP